jgi:hypothetical protein
MYENYFLPSFPKDDRLDLRVVNAPQLAGEKPSFNSPDWKNFMHIKAEVLYDELINIPENEIYGFLDVDIINVNNFHDFIIKEMEGLDFLCQNDSNNPNFLNACTGVIFFRNTQTCRNLLLLMNTYLDKFNNEQEAFSYFVNSYRSIQQIQTLSYKFLPFSNAFTYGAFGKGVWYNQDLDFAIPDKKDLYWLHANYCHHEYKEPLLDLFLKKLHV